MQCMPLLFFLLTCGLFSIFFFIIFVHFILIHLSAAVARACDFLRVFFGGIFIYLLPSKSSSSLWIPQSKPISFDPIVSFDGSLICCFCCGFDFLYLFLTVQSPRLWLIIYIAARERERETSKIAIYNYVNLILSMYSIYVPFFCRCSS